MLEFIFVLPLYLLLFGGTFLTFELSFARIHLQEANRNLAWLTGDRYDRPKENGGDTTNSETGFIAIRLHDEVQHYYKERNVLESRISFLAGDMYGFGDHADKPGSWGFRIDSFSDGTDAGKVSIEVNAKDDGNWLMSLLPGNSWCGLYTGNMELKMNHVSMAYIGAIASSDILHPNTGGRELYKASYELTRATDKNDENLAVNGEALLIRRKSDNEYRAKLNTASVGLSKMTLEGWPVGDGILKAIITEAITELSSDIGDKLNAWGN